MFKFFEKNDGFLILKELNSLINEINEFPRPIRFGAQTISAELIPVQPMDPPSGVLFFFDNKKKFKFFN